MRTTAMCARFAPRVLACLALALAPLSLQARVWLAAGGGQTGTQRVTNAGLEEVAADGKATGFTFWEAGYVVDEAVHRGGARSARCVSTDPKVEYGAGQRVVLNQAHPVPILARVWSRADAVSGTPDSGYSLYLDLEYMDGTPLWGQIAVFGTGTHDWEQARVLVMPAKPVKSVNVLGLFRGHTGRAWFDDYELFELEGVGQFDLLPSAGEVPAAAAGAAWEPVGAAPSSGLLLDPRAGAMTLDPTRVGGLAVRDAAANSDWVLPDLSVRADGAGKVLTGTVPGLDLGVEARLVPDGDAVRLTATVRDTSGRGRAITVYWLLPVPAAAWVWCQDPRTSSPTAEQGTCGNLRQVNAGANGLASLYPFAAVVDERRGLAVGAPLSTPRLARFLFDNPRRLLVAAFDLGLSPAVARSPQQATVEAVLFPFAPEWRFRAAFDRYARLHPDSFANRVERQGIWMPFQDIATVQGWEDFGFQFQEGAPNPLFDEQHGIGSYPYIEPMSYWMDMAAGVPRTVEAALAQLQALAAKGEKRAVATLSSGLYGADDRPILSIEDAPWCNGALFLLNPDPDLPGTAGAPVTQYQVHQDTIRPALEDDLPRPTWARYQGGYELAAGEGRNGSRAARCARTNGAGPMGLCQTVVLAQTEPREVVATAWSRAADVTGQPTPNYCLYLDLTLAGGEHLFGRTTPFAIGTHDWQQVEVRVVPAKPIQSLTFYLLLRGDCAGTAWFDDIALQEAGSETNRVLDGTFDGDAQERVSIDGVYLDSYEMAATHLDYRRQHFAAADLPLVFDRSGRVCQFGHFQVLELSRLLARQLHERHKLLFANAVYHTFPWPADHLDIAGTETNWNPGGTWRPDTDERMLYWRAMTLHRPYLLLQNTDFDRFPPTGVERYFARSCAYGILPSFFSPNAATGVYWSRPELYNRDRPLFTRYIPVIRRLAEAGWEPVTLARSSDPEVWVERFGRGADVYLTAFNGTAERRTATITLEPAAPAGAPAELLLPAPGPVALAGTPPAWSVTLEPEAVAVLHLGGQGGAK